MPPFTVHERRAIITGGANGLGLAFARRLVAEGARVCISDIAVEAGEKAVKDICKQNHVGKNRCNDPVECLYLGTCITLVSCSESALSSAMWPPRRSGTAFGTRQKNNWKERLRSFATMQEFRQQ
jgi:NAD(P)-dependent dehydrogenase (short-subunit alcohol dehydrogenase family)